MKKSGDLLPKIIGAKTREESIHVLNKILQALHLSTSYLEMVRLQDRVEHYQREFKTVCSQLDNEVRDNSYEYMNNIRKELSFLYRDIQDELSHPINSNKIYYEEIKTARRADALEELIDSEEAKKYNAKSASALREILGASKSYREYATEYAIAYGNYKTLEALLSSIKLTIEAIASKEKRELYILNSDVK